MGRSRSVILIAGLTPSRVGWRSKGFGNHCSNSKKKTLREAKERSGDVVMGGACRRAKGQGTSKQGAAENNKAGRN